MHVLYALIIQDRLRNKLNARLHRKAQALLIQEAVIAAAGQAAVVAAADLLGRNYKLL